MNHLGLVIIGIFWLTAILLVKRWPNDSSFTMSRHAASNRMAYLMMAVSESVYLPLFSLWIMLWFVPNIGVTAWFGYLNILVSAAFLIAAWVPQTKGWKGRMHVYAAFSGAALMIPMMFILALSSNLPEITRIIAALGALYMLSSSLIYKFWARARSVQLYIQGLYFLFAHIAVISAIYIG